MRSSASPTPVKLRWSRNRLFDKLATMTLFSLIADRSSGTVTA